MQDDLAALKKGQPPAGFKIEKESEKESRPAPQEAIPSKTTPPPTISHVELGKLEKARPLTAEAQPLRQAGLGVGQVQKPVIPVIPQLGLSKPSISVPSVGGILGRFRGRPDFKRIIIYTIVGIVGFGITAYLIPYFTSLPATSISPTPSVAVTSTATPVSIESLFSVSDSINVNIPLGGDPTVSLIGQFLNSGKLDALTSSGETGVYKINNKNGAKQYGFAEFMDGMLAESPTELKSLVDDSSLLLTVMLKTDGTVSFGLVVKLQNVDTTAAVRTVLQNWENTMKRSLVNMLYFDMAKAASVGFLDNVYRGSAIRYINFPDPTSTIDYSVVQAKNGESYLVMVNSREHIYKILDKLK